MKKSLLLTVCAVSVLAMTSVQAIEIKKPEVGALKGATSAISNATSSLTPTGVRGTISEINSQLVTADKTVQEAFSSLVSALSSKEEADKIKKEMKAINDNKNLSATEKSAKLAAVMSDYGNTLKEQKDEMGKKLESATEAKWTEIINATDTLFGATAQYLAIANNCRSVAMSVSANPTLAVTLAPELASLKDTAIILKNNVKSIKDVTTQAVAVAKIGGKEIKLSKPKTSKASKVDLTKLSK